MIIAGIDEAGFGPVLGPLVVSATAFSLPDEHAGTSLWKVLSGTVTRKVSKRKSTLAIGDSKQLYSGLRGAVGLENLERGVLAMLRTQGCAVSCLRELLAAISPGALEHKAQYAWYGDDALALPTCVSPVDLALISNALSVAMSRTGVKLELVRSETVFEGEFNRIIQATNNKSTLLVDVTCRQLMHLWQKFSAGGVRIYVDHQGGRVYYLSTLERVFDGCKFRVIDERDDYSAYMVTDGDRWAEIHFQVECEQAHMPVALASMASKYLRELFMTIFNRYWAVHVPGVAPTAGYHGDGTRFYQEILPAIQRLGVEQHMLYRSR